MKNTACCVTQQAVFFVFCGTFIANIYKIKSNLASTKFKYFKNVENISKIVLTKVELSDTI